MFSACFWQEQGFRSSAKWFIYKFGQTDLHVFLRKHTISIYFCLEGLGFRVCSRREVLAGVWSTPKPLAQTRSPIEASKKDHDFAHGGVSTKGFAKCKIATPQRSVQERA